MSSDTSLPPTVLNAFEVKGLVGLTWQVTEYLFSRLDGREISFDDAKELKGVMWDLKREHQARCKGHGFVIIGAPNRILVPTALAIPDQESYRGFRITRQANQVVRASRKEDWPVVQPILKEAVKGQFKSKREAVSELGPLWQDANDFCTLPKVDSPGGHRYFRRIIVTPERLAEGRIVLEVAIKTVSLDSDSLGAYYARGDVATLARRVELKRKNRRKRRTGGEPDVGVLFLGDKHNPLETRKLTLAEPDLILTDAELSPAEQKRGAGATVPCEDWTGSRSELAAEQVYLILDTLITGKDHEETLLEPAIRNNTYIAVRNLLSGMAAFGQSLVLAPELFQVPPSQIVVIRPPDLRIKTSSDKESVLRAGPSSDGGLKKRARDRSRLVRQNGFLDVPRPSLRPLVVAPSWYGKVRAQRLVDDLNMLIDKKDYPFRFAGPILYDRVTEIAEAVGTTHNALFAVLPEGRHTSQAELDTHDLIKRQVGVSSQCMQHDNTLPEHFVGTSWQALRNTHQQVAREVQGRYEVSVQALLLKHAWLPFFPETGFHYNTHIGIDVGGPSNDHVMACIGHNLSAGDRIILPRKIPVGPLQREPIYAPDLFEGIKSMVDLLREPYQRRGQDTSLERVLFFRDGELRGQGDEWHEEQAFDQLFEHYLKLGIISSQAVWTAVELPKRAALWRQYREFPYGLDNPLFGTASFMFDNPNEVLLTTTGSPYVTQGTAEPLRVRFRKINGNFDKHEVLQDLVWECDLGFPKQDTSLSLPWVLYVANAGALQIAKNYEVTGITV